MNTRDQIEATGLGLYLVIVGATGDVPVLDLLFVLGGLTTIMWAGRTPKPKKETP